MVTQGIAAVNGETPARVQVLQIIAAVAGLLILGGLWTPVAGLLAGMLELGIACTAPGTRSFGILLAGMAIGLAMIGPGTWSLDAQLYGRKQIFPPEP